MKALVFFWFVALASVGWKVYYGIASPNYDGSNMNSLIGMALVWVVLTFVIIAVWIVGKLKSAVARKLANEMTANQT